MACLTVKPDDLKVNGPLLDLNVLESSALVASRKITQEQDIKPEKGSFLIDTGASMSLIDISLIKKLGLNPTGTTKIRTPSSSAHEVETYAVDLFIPTHNVRLKNRSIIATDLSAQNISGLIGRDILKHFLFIYNGNTGEFTLAF